ncbi:MAG TPA: Rsd/AlgQ family anti-sigma factor [Gammaproteobacteria bacterium]|nr:Rsd/AlgQ family anti-sigma factor [Gammaproteobacteria bacterium]
MESRSPQRRSGSKKVCQDLLQQRARLLLQYCQISDVCVQENGTTADLLHRFCQNLVDYVATGHFALYDRIIKGGERRQRVQYLAKSLYPQILESTSKVVSFSDRYAQSTDHFSLQQDLSTLGEVLAGRISVEDQLLAELVTGLNFSISVPDDSRPPIPVPT